MDGSHEHNNRGIMQTHSFWSDICLLWRNALNMFMFVMMDYFHIVSRAVPHHCFSNQTLFQLLAARSYFIVNMLSTVHHFGSVCQLKELWLRWYIRCLLHAHCSAADGLLMAIHHSELCRMCRESSKGAVFVTLTFIVFPSLKRGIALWIVFIAFLESCWGKCVHVFWVLVFLASDQTAQTFFSLSNEKLFLLWFDETRGDLVSTTEPNKCFPELKGLITRKQDTQYRLEKQGIRLKCNHIWS